MRCGGRAVTSSSRSSDSVEVGAALGRGQRVDLVDDDRLDADQGLGRRRGEHQVEALGCGDEQIGRPPDQRWRSATTVSPVRIADLGRGHRLAEPLGGQADAGQRRPQVLLDVERERPQRRDVEHPGARLRSSGAGVGDELRRSPARNAASVLPLPVGAQIRVCSPAGDRPANPAPAPPSAPGTTRRTTPARRARTPRAPGDPR